MCCDASREGELCTAVNCGTPALRQRSSSGDCDVVGGEPSVTTVGAAEHRGHRPAAVGPLPHPALATQAGVEDSTAAQMKAS